MVAHVLPSTRLKSANSHSVIKSKPSYLPQLSLHTCHAMLESVNSLTLNTHGASKPPVIPLQLINFLSQNSDCYLSPNNL
ncbi:hypothetical protein Tco_0555008, partial [Tanacetum coccineum]